MFFFRPSLRSSVSSRFVRGSAVFDDEEQWFNQDEEDEDDTEISTSTQPSIGLENLPSLLFPSSSSPPSSSLSSDSNKTPSRSTPSSSTTTSTTPSFALLIPSTSSSTAESLPSPLLNRRVGLSYPPISIHIKSTNLGVFGNSENEGEAGVSLSSLSRNASKRSGGIDEDDKAASSSSSGGDASSGSDGDEEATLARPSKRPLVNHQDEQIDKNNNNSSSVDSLEGNPDNPESSKAVSI